MPIPSVGWWILANGLKTFQYQRPYMLIKLPFPDMRLSPNRKNGKHWSSTNTIKKAAFECAYYLTREAMASENYKSIPTYMEITFIAPDRRKRDLDNLLSSCKSQIDGICKALGVDDSIFEKIILIRGYGVCKSDKGSGLLIFID